ncbi:hypothetical protein D9M70_620730 [compost metagenome]
MSFRQMILGRTIGPFAVTFSLPLDFFVQFRQPIPYAMDGVQQGFTEWFVDCLAQLVDMAA